jgi:hypothetical protein
MVRTCRAHIEAAEAVEDAAEAAEAEAARLRFGVDSGSRADRRALLLAAEASPSVALLAAAWANVAAAVAADSGRDGRTYAEELLVAVALLPLRKRADELAAAAALACRQTSVHGGGDVGGVGAAGGRLLSFPLAFPRTALRFASEACATWGVRVEPLGPTAGSDSSVHAPVLASLARAVLGGLAAIPDLILADPDLIDELLACAAVFADKCPHHLAECGSALLAIASAAMTHQEARDETIRFMDG